MFINGQTSDFSDINNLESSSCQMTPKEILDSIDRFNSKKHFEGIPSEWHETIRITSPLSNRVKMRFKCLYNGCNSIFDKSCNLKDHFRKHTRQKPYKCNLCDMKYTQRGSLGRHLRSFHGIIGNSPNQSTILGKRSLESS